MQTDQKLSGFEIDLRGHLVETLAQHKVKNSLYSIRAFAKKLGVSPAALSQILNGKRKLTKKTAQKMIARLHLDPSERQKFLDKLENRKRRLSQAKKDYVQLQMDHYHMISDWYYFGILSLAETNDFKSQPAWISRRLGIRIQEAEKALVVLERLKLLKKEKNADLGPSGISFKTSTDIPNVFLQKGHVDNLGLARRSLERDPVEIRDFSSMTMAIDPALIPEAKEKILKFRRSLCEFLESGEKKEVYKLNIQIFPLTQNEVKK